MKKKTKIILLSVLAILILVLCTTYAYFVVVKKQKEVNELTVSCLDISITNEKDDITLTEAYPLTDEEGLALIPYTFNVINNCDTSIDYEIKLELTGEKSNSINANSIKYTLDGKAPLLLTDKNSGKVTLENAYEAYILGYGSLSTKNSSNSHSLRLWIDEFAPVSESDKLFKSKISVSIGDEIEVKTLAEAILESYGGKDKISSINDKWTEGPTGEEEAVWVVGYGSPNFYATDYEFDPKKGYTLSGEIVSADLQECRTGAKKCGKYSLLNYSYDFSKSVSTTLYTISSFTSDYGDWYITAKKTELIGNELASTTAADSANLYKAPDDYGTSYYFRGDVENNYVKFGKWSEDATEIRGYWSKSSLTDYRTYSSIKDCNESSRYNVNCSEIPKEEAGKDMYWRILRINGDGTIRLIYDGTEAIANGTKHTATIGTTVYNANIDNAKYVGYTYEGEDGTQTDSDIKKLIDTWYNTNLKARYNPYIADSVFCNDKEVLYSNEKYIYYASYNRLKNAFANLACTQKENRYTVNKEIGNGYLTNPVGIITADEMLLAGNYILNNVHTWTMTPLKYLYRDSDYEPYIEMQFWLDPKSSTTWGADNVKEVRPVINLKADVEFTGEGTIDNPYEIITN